MTDHTALIEALERAEAAYDRVMAMDAEPDVMAIAAGLTLPLHGQLFGQAAAALRAKRCAVVSGPVVELSLELLAGFLERQGLPHGAKHLRQTAATITALQAEVARKDVAMERAIMLIERNLYRQSEKVEDAKNILRAALERPKP